MIRAWSVLHSSPWAILSRTLTCWNISIRKWKKITNNQGKVRVLKRRSRNMSYVASQMFFNRNHIVRIQHSSLAEICYASNSCKVRMHYTFLLYTSNTLSFILLNNYIIPIARAVLYYNLKEKELVDDVYFH